MKTIRAVVVLIVMFQMFGLVSGVSYLTLFGIWALSWVVTIIWTPIKTAIKLQLSDSLVEAIIEMEEDE